MLLGLGGIGVVMLFGIGHLVVGAMILVGLRRSMCPPEGCSARCRASTTAFSRSASLHKPSVTGLRGLILAVFQWLRSRTLAMVSLVVPISLPICASDRSG